MQELENMVLGFVQRNAVIEGQCSFDTGKYALEVNTSTQEDGTIKPLNVYKTTLSIRAMMAEIDKIDEEISLMKGVKEWTFVSVEGNGHYRREFHDFEPNDVFSMNVTGTYTEDGKLSEVDAKISVNDNYSSQVEKDDWVQTRRASLETPDRTVFGDYRNNVGNLVGKIVADIDFEKEDERITVSITERYGARQSYTFTFPLTDVPVKEKLTQVFAEFEQTTLN